MDKLEELLEWGGVKKDITLLIISGIALLLSIFMHFRDCHLIFHGLRSFCVEYQLFLKQ